MYHQDTKGVWWMPWHRKPMKDVASCDKPCGAASGLGSTDLRMGKPGTGNAVSPPSEHIGREEGTRGNDTSEYPEENKESLDSLSSGERKGRKPKTDARKAPGGSYSGVLGQLWRSA